LSLFSWENTLNLKRHLRRIARWAARRIDTSMACPETRHLVRTVCTAVASSTVTLLVVGWAFGFAGLMRGELVELTPARGAALAACLLTAAAALAVRFFLDESIYRYDRYAP
jgi:hypothetical protein